MDRKKIAFIIHGFPMGGAEKFLINIVNHFYQNGHQPVVITLSEDRALIHELNENIKVHTILKKSRLDLSISKRIKAVIKEEGIRKIFCINTYAFFLAKLAFLFDNKTKFYLSAHSTIPATKKNYWQNFFYFRVLSKRDWVLYLCKNQQQYLEKKYFLSPGLSRVIYNGIDTSYFDPLLFKNLDTLSLRAEYGLKENDKVIIKVARLYNEKGHLDAIDALQVLQTTLGKKAHLLFVGGGEPVYTQFLKDHAKENGVEQYVHFAGNQPDVRKFYCIADIFTLTSYSIETFSLAALEAMAFGLPCSLTDIGGASEMAIEGLSGTLSKPKNAVSIAESWNRLLEAHMKGPSIRQFVIDHFTSEKMVRQYLELLTKDE